MAREMEQKEERLVKVQNDFPPQGVGMPGILSGGLRPQLRLFLLYKMLRVTDLSQDCHRKAAADPGMERGLPQGWCDLEGKEERGEQIWGMCRCYDWRWWFGGLMRITMVAYCCTKMFLW